MSRKKLQVVQAVRHQEFSLPAKEQALLDKMFKAYVSRRRGSLNHTEKTVNNDMATIRNFIEFCGKAPWNCTENDFDAWCDGLRNSKHSDRRLAVETQRKYQTAIQLFYRYISTNVQFLPEVQRTFGVHLRQIVTEENKIPHLDEKQGTQRRSALSHMEINMFFNAIDQGIVEACRFRSKSFRVLQRDKVMFFCMYSLGLRNSECRNLTLDSFQPNPKLPEFGQFGMVTVYGKGSKGTGPKMRTVPVEHPGLPPLLGWYIANVRPHLACGPRADPNERALFLSDHSRRMKPNTLIARFHKIIKYANLEGLGFTPHCLRHTYTTHVTEMGMSLEYVRRKLGHSYAATTQLYTHLGDEFVNKELTRVSRLLLDRIDNEFPDDGGRERE